MASNTTSSNSLLASVPKLRGRSNYNEWAFAMENLLILEGIDCFKTESTSSADDAKAKAKLILTIDPALYVHIKEAPTSRDLWMKLRQMFDDAGFSRRITLLRNLISIRLESSESMISYITQIIETGQKLCCTGFQVNDQWIGSLLLAGLPDKYYPMIMAIEHSGIAITADVIKTKLLDMAGSENEPESAFFGRGQHQRDFCNVGSKASDINLKNSVNVNGGQNRKAFTKSEVICYKCKRKGHYKNQCPQNKSQETQKTHGFSAVFLSGNFNKSEWYLDSGASCHMTPNEDIVQNASAQLNIKQIVAANKSVMSVSCIGDVEIVTLTPKCRYEVTIKDVLCVPKLAASLISVSQLIKNGNRVDFSENSCRIFNKRNELVAVANLFEGVYKLNVEFKKCLFTSSSSGSSQLWHRRLGHLNWDDMKKMKYGAVTGVSFTDKEAIKKGTYTVCCEGKQSLLSFNNSGTRSTGAREARVCVLWELKMKK